jgi:hypothetical protein
MKDPLLEEIDELITRAECWHKSRSIGLPSSNEEETIDIFLGILQALRRFVVRTNLPAIPGVNSPRDSKP